MFKNIINIIRLIILRFTRHDITYYMVINLLS